MTKVIISFLALVFLFSTDMSAQFASDVLRFSRRDILFDPIQLGLAGANLAGKSSASSALQNPAQLALLDNSELSVGFNTFRQQNDSEFFGQSTSTDAQQLGLNNFTYAYKIPTVQGSFVFGLGYAQSQSVNRVSSGRLFNQNTTITDQFPIDSYYFARAYDAFAIDSLGAGTASIWRVGGDYQGIYQDYSVTEVGNVGELQLFLATEFKKNLFIGVNIMMSFGQYRYQRDFLELDLDNVYTDVTVDNDVSEIALQDKIRTDYQGISAKLGVIYKINPIIHVAAAFQTAQNLSFEEDYSVTIQTIFDNTDIERAGFDRDNNYDIRTPSRTNIGISLFPSNHIEIHTNISYQNFSRAEINLRGGLFDRDTRDRERGINNQIANDFNPWVGLATGLVFKPNQFSQVMLGYQWFPHNELSESSDLGTISGGFSFALSKNVMLDVSGRVREFSDQYAQYFDAQNDYFVNEQNLDITISAGVRIGF